MRHRSRTATLLAALSALLLPLLPTATAQADALGPKTYNVWHWNVAGDKIHDGATGNGLISQAASSIVNRAADFAAFNELCQNQFDALIRDLRTRAWPQDPQNFARFEPSRQPGNASVCQGGAFGNAIFSKRPLGTADRLALPHDGTAEQRNMLCAPLVDGSGTRFCTTHITTSQTHNVSQLTFVRDRLESYHTAGETALIAGDFNAQPNYGRLNSYYSPSLNVPNNPNNTGQYRELDDNDSANCVGYGEWTAEGTPGTAPPCGTKAKIDLIFVRESAIAGPYSADSLSISTSCTGVTACSDHRILTGTVTVA
ncbi:endonuclease/exonuclease/phosphatase family protein [Streptomyces sp. NPDC020965]|uniref:endonuclease/exonuclease/phosphatase family protein n=1 Tax=Streptomyces sp. NPDC020965 TaxID=3365105 RepID=UPI0037B96FBC